MKKIFSLCLVLFLSLSMYTVSSAITVEGTEEEPVQEGFSYEFSNKYCESLFMITTETGETVYSYNADEERAIASLTKIMTYIVAYENIPDIENVVITVNQETADILTATNSSLSGVKIGEELTGLQLLNLMMVPSGNDASLVLSMYYDSLQGEYNEFTGVDDNGIDTRATDMSYSPFIKLMNEKAKELGCENTNFTNPHGLHHDNHYSTARDMSVITRYATTLPYFTEITGQSYYVLDATNISSEPREIYNTNAMFSQYVDSGKYYYEYTTGIKTGSLNESGFCIASSAAYDGYSYIVIALGSPYRDEEGVYIDNNGAMLDAKSLFQWAHQNLRDQMVAEEGALLGDIPIEYSWDTETLRLVAEENLQVLLPKDILSTSVVVTLEVPEKVQAPINEGDVIGTAVFSYAGDEIGRVNVMAAESVSRSNLLMTVTVGTDIVTSPAFITVSVIIVLIIAAYITITVRFNKKRQKEKKKYKRFKDM